MCTCEHLCCLLSTQSGGYSVARSQSAAAGARPARSRSKSPRRSLSPPADREASWRYTGAAGASNPRSYHHRGPDPARNTVAETRTFLSRPLIITLLPLTIDFLALFLFIFCFTHLPLPSSYSI